MPRTAYPSLYQINTRVVLNELGLDLNLGRQATLDDIPDSVLNGIAALGFDWVWFLGIWQVGTKSRAVSRTLPNLMAEFQAELPDFTVADVTGSPYAVADFSVNTDFGGPAALARLRARLKQRGLKLLLDLVPNHVALDHPWIESHPEYFISGTEADLAREPRNYIRLETPAGPRIYAYGRDPYFDGWQDTLQLNYRHPEMRQAMQTELLKIAQQCDGVRCDMAMLILPEVFQRTWGEKSLPSDGTPPDDSLFWPEAISKVQAARPGFLFMAEVYWNLEWTLQQQGFDYTYDKHYYDCLREQRVDNILGHLHADLSFMQRSTRFLENHDELRAAAVFPGPMHKAAAVLTYLVPGLRFFHEGQFEGRKSRVSIHLGRRPPEPVDAGLQDFYRQLLDCLRRPEVRFGQWRLLDCHSAWDGNNTFQKFVVFYWQDGSRRLLVAVNYGSTWGQCYVPLPAEGLRDRRILLKDLLGSARYDRQGNELANMGLYLDMPDWGCHAFELQDL